MLSALAGSLVATAPLAATPASAGHVRVATYHAELSRRGPGILLRDIREGEDAQIAAAVAVIAAADPDILLLNGFDWDLRGRALAAFADRLAAAGAPYPHRFAARPNSGLRTGLDLDGDGRRGRARDAQGYGRFPGEGGMALLSRFPIRRDRVRDFSAMLWSALPGALLPEAGGAPFPSAGAQAVQRLSDTAHWDVPVAVGPGAPLRLLAWHATPSVFDGEADRNGRRNHDEARFWSLYLDGLLADAPPARRFVVIGDANMDPADGDGRPGALQALLADPRLTDPEPTSAGGRAAAAAQGGPNAAQTGDPALDTADWPETDGEGAKAEPGPGNLRVDYVLPSADLTVTASGVLWPEPGGGPPAAETVAAASRHRLVWVDLALESAGNGGAGGPARDAGQDRGAVPADWWP